MQPTLFMFVQGAHLQMKIGIFGSPLKSHDACLGMTHVDLNPLEDKSNIINNIVGNIEEAIPS